MHESFSLGPHSVKVLQESESLDLVEGSFAPGVPGPPPHRHDWVEAFYVISGRLEVSVDGEQRVLGAGDFAIALAGSLHTFSVDGADPAVFVATFGPRGLDYIREMAAIFEGSGADPEALGALHQRYGVTTG